MKARRSTETRRRAPQRAGERELAQAPLYVSLSLGLSYVNWAGQECCLFYLRSLLRSLDLLLFHFRGLFPSLSVATTILDFCSLFYLSNTYIMTFFLFLSPHCTTYRFLVPDQGSNPGTLQWKCKFLIIGLPGMSLS